jgi:hypothetical protein
VEGTIPLEAWNLDRAAVVAGPKYVDSSPLEPTPDVDTGNPWVLRKICRALTSDPVDPMVSERVYVDDVVVTTVGVHGTVDDVPSIELTFFMVIGPNRPEDGSIPLASWNLATALVVAGPKYVDSLPLEPIPVVET